MDYFSKVKSATLKAASQGMQFIQSVASAASDIGGYSLRTPEEEMIYRFRSTCHLVDEYSALDELSTNRDAAYYDARIKEAIRELLACLQAEDKRWINSHMQNGTTELKDHPVLELFLQHRVMEELCVRAIQDKPQGLLPLVIAATTSILRNIRYPLLPHQRVHKPLSQLLSHATDLSAQYSLASKRHPDAAQRADMISYTRRIDGNLANLIFCLWRKIYESPQTLDFFSFIEPPTAAVAEDSSRPCTSHQLVQLDLVKCLIPLMGKQRIGATAKEALLLAVSLHDTRINYYILHETRLMHNVVTELSKKYLQAVESLISTSATSTSSFPASPTSSLPIVTREATAAFEKVLRFCSALVLASSSKASINYMHADISGKSTMGSAVFVPPKTVNLFGEISREFTEVFLATCLMPLLMDNAEQQVVATQAVCRLMLRELLAMSSSVGFSKHNNTTIHPIAQLVSRYLCRSSELSSVLLARASSASKDVSLSTLLLLESLVSCAGLNDLEIFLLRIHGSTAEGVGDELVSDAAPANTNIDSVLNTLQFPTQSHGSNNSDDSSGNSSSVKNKKVPASVEQYMNCAIDCIMNRIQFSFCSDDIRSSAFASSDASQLASVLGRGPLLSLLLKKLKIFSTLRFEEQLAITGVAQQAVNFLCVLVSSSAAPDAVKAQVAFVELLNMFKTIKSAEREISGHVKKIADASYKLEIVRAILSNSDATSAAKLRKALDKEGTQVIRILESTVLLRELIHELHGYLLAVKKLRVIFAADSLAVFTSHCEESFTNKCSGDIHDECASVSDDDATDQLHWKTEKYIDEDINEEDFERDWTAMSNELSELAMINKEGETLVEVIAT